MNESNKICQEAGEIHFSLIYNIVLGCVILFNFIALPLLVNSFIFLLRTGKICFYLRLFLLNMTIALILRALLTSYRAFNRIFRALTVTNPCDFTATIFECAFESFLQAVPYAVPFYSFPMIAAERLAATVFRKLYEHFLFRLLVCLGILGNWTYMIVKYYLDLLPLQSVPTVLPFCSSITNTEHFTYFKVFIDNQFLLPFFSLITCLGVYQFCKYKKERFFKLRKTSHSLAERYKLTEIIRTSRIVLLLCSILCGLHILYQMILLVSVVHFEVNTLRKFSVIKEISSFLVMPIFANIYGLTFLVMQKTATKNPVTFAKLSSNSNNNYNNEQPPNRRHRSFVSPLTTETDAYFNIYASTWK